MAEANLPLEVYVTDDVDIANDMFKPTPDEYYRQFDDYIPPIHDTEFIYKILPALKDELKGLDIDLFIVKWNIYSADMKSGTYIDNFLLKMKKPYMDDFMYMNETQIYGASREPDGCIYINWMIKQEKWQAATDVLKKYFPNRTHGINNFHMAVTIRFNGLENYQLRYMANIEVTLTKEFEDEERDNLISDIINKLNCNTIELSECDTIMKGRTSIHVFLSPHNINTLKRNVHNLIEIPHITDAEILYISDEKGNNV